MAPTLGESIRASRQRKGWTLKDLAATTGLSVPYLSDLERRPGVNPTLDTLTTIATALGCSVTDLLGGDGTKAGEPSALPPSLARFIRSTEFEQEVQLIAGRNENRHAHSPNGPRREKNELALVKDAGRVFEQKFEHDSRFKNTR